MLVTGYQHIIVCNMLRNLLGTGSVLSSIGNILLEKIMLLVPSFVGKIKECFPQNVINTLPTKRSEGK